LWFDGHASASTNIYYEVDVAAGEAMNRIVEGYRYSTSPDGRHLAYGIISRGVREAGTESIRVESASVVLDGKVVYPPTGDALEYTLLSPFVWAPDNSQFAFIASTGDVNNAHLLLAKLNGGACTVTRVATPQAPEQVYWLPDGVLAFSSNAGYFNVEPDSGRALAMGEQTVRQWLVVISDHKSMYVEDCFCAGSAVAGWRE
jgi:hypothetical protein